MMRLIENLGGWFIYAAFLLVTVGDLYWLWISIKIGSFAMFFLGMVPPFVIVTGPIGAWSLLFGVPYWLTDIFG